MNVWKPIALCFAAGFVASVGIQVASANKNPDPPPSLTGPCFDQPNMAHTKASIEDALTYAAKAEHNKGGWRDRAMVALNTAHNEINAGCNVANGK
ncbi:MAG: hypothetical protein ABSE49_12740 [Polyangiaceae bacterium]|jgi:hypothetical protein